MNSVKYVLFAMLLVLTTVSKVSAEIDVSKLVVNTTPVASSKNIIQQADLVVFGWPDQNEKKYPTGKKIDQYQIINFVQAIHIQKVLKGSSPALIHLVTVGAEPLPTPSNPINKMYPGPLAKENYILFLKKLPQSEYYTIIGGWQGIYPLFEGKTISLEGLGFKEFNGLTVEQLEQMLR